MRHPCPYDTYYDRSIKLGLKPLGHKAWHDWWDDALTSGDFNVLAAKDSFYEQRNSAQERNIQWFFTFESWVDWWINDLGDDWQKKRGRRSGQYVMARNGDVGPYKIGNVRAILGHDNQIEAGLNGRRPKGEKHGFSKMTDKGVLEIYKNKEDSYSTLAKKYGVHQRHIAAIRRGEVWNHITGHPKPKKGLMRYLTKDERAAILKSNSSTTYLADKFKVHVSTIRRLKGGRR